MTDRWQRMSTKSRLPVAFWLVVPVGVGYLLAVTHPYWMNLNSDAIHYLTAASNLLEWGTLRTYTGAPLVSYAPLLSVVYAGIGSLGIDLRTAAVVTNVVAYIVLISVVARWLTHAQVAPTVANAALLAVSFAAPATAYHIAPISEPLYFALSVSALYSGWVFVNSGSRLAFAVAIVLAGASALTRWIGVTVVMSIGLFLLWHSSVPLRKRVFTAGFFTGVSLLPFALWVLRNYLLSGTFFGMRERSDYPLREMVFDTLYSIGSWFIPFQFKGRTTLFALLTLALVFCILILLRKLRSLWDKPKYFMTAACVLYVLIYSTVLVLSASSAKFEELGSRMWSPVFVPAALVIACLLEILPKDGILQRIFRAIVALLWMGCLVTGVVSKYNQIVQTFADGPGRFNLREWRHNATFRWVREFQPNGLVFSNFPEPLFWYTGVVGYYTPHHGPMRVASETHPRNGRQFLATVKEHLARGEPVYVIWLDNAQRSGFLWGLEELHDLVDMDVVKKLPDGTVFRVVGVAHEHEEVPQ